MSQQADVLINLISDLRKSNKEFCVATIVRTEAATSAKAGAKAVITREGEIKGFVGGACVQTALKRTASVVLKEGVPRLIRVKPKIEVNNNMDLDGVELHGSSCPSGGTVDFFVEPMLLAPHLVVCGASPVTLALAELGACMGYRVTAASLAEDHPVSKRPEQNHDGFNLTSLKIGPNDFVVVATQGKRDREALTSALLSNADYVAFVGSQKKTTVLKSQLLEQGISEKQLQRLSAPAGLDIHAIEPVEIAVSIIGEIVLHRRQAVSATIVNDEPSAI